jgi:hypothetical protein
MAADDAIPSQVDDEAAETSERFAPARRRPWLGIICALCLVLAGLAWWIHAENPFNPYRNGTTHAATLAQNTGCPGQWGVEIDHGGYVWQNESPVPASWAPGPVDGRVHILHQRLNLPPSGPKAVTAWFEARGIRIQLVGGKEPVFFYAACALR